MKREQKAMVMLLICTMVFSMAFAPWGGISAAAAEPDTVAPSVSDVEKEATQEWADRLIDTMETKERMDPALRSFMQSGELSEDVALTADDNIKVVLYLGPDADYTAVKQVVNAQWRMDFGMFAVVSASLKSDTALKVLDGMEGIQYIQADTYLTGSPVEEVVAPEMFNINDIIGRTGTYATDYDGTNVIVGLDDTGVDFSIPDMQDALYIDDEGRPTSYDGSGFGLTEMTIANNTYVDNTTAWLEGGNLLTYEMGGKYYLNTTGWDPVVNNNGGHRHLLGLLPPYGDGYPFGPTIGFIGLYEYFWGATGSNVSKFVYEQMWKDWEIPAPTGENYTFGWVFQQRQNAYAKVFAPSMIYDGHVVLDWNGTKAWTNMWELGIDYQVLNFTKTADQDYITGMMDWSFTDDVSEGYWYNASATTGTSNPILAADLDDDGDDDIGLGSLTWVYDGFGYLSAGIDDFFCGIEDNNMAWAAMFPSESEHGQWTAAAVGSRGVYDHMVYNSTHSADQYSNETTYKLPGVADGSKIIGVKGLTSGADLGAQFWAAGFHLQPDGNFTYDEDGEKHKAHIVSNSWGYVSGSYLTLTYLTLMWDLMSVPDVMNATYPGTLFFVSAGNSGPDYMTNGAPDSAFSVVSVGGTIATHVYDDIYGPQEDLNQEAWFTSNGPAFTGHIKPDIVAPSIFGVNPGQFTDVWLGFDDSYTWWSGTSLACPVAAGGAALIIEALMTEYPSWDFNPQIVKDILLSSAKDIGLETPVQGNGLVDVEAAIEAIETNSATDYIIESKSFVNYKAIMQQAWSYWMPGYQSFGVWVDSGKTTPVGLESTSIFFGNVEPGMSYKVNMTMMDYSDLANPTYVQDPSTTMGGMYYAMSDTFTYDVETRAHNDTLFNTYRGDVLNLTELMGNDNKTFFDANYATIIASFDSDLFYEDANGNMQSPIGLRVLDYNDTNGDGVTNYYWNSTYPGDHMQWVSRDTNDCNVLMARVVNPSGTLGDLFDHHPGIFLSDPNANETIGSDVKLTVIVWEPQTEAGIGLETDTLDHFNVTLDVPADAEYGIHTGAIEIEGQWVPYSYMVKWTMDVPKNTPQTLVDTFGNELTPYDNGALWGSFVAPDAAYAIDAGGHRTFAIEIPDDYPTKNHSVLVMRAEWQNAGTSVDMYLRAPTYSLLWKTPDGDGPPFAPEPTGTTSNTVVYDPGHLINGSYYLDVVAHEIDGSDVPENITITLLWYDALPEPTIEPTWTARETTTPELFEGGDSLVGDHVVVQNDWDVTTPANLSEYHIVNSTIDFLSGLYDVHTGTVADPQGQDTWPIPLSNTDTYKWETTEGINENDEVRISLVMDPACDPSFDAYVWDDANDDGEVQLDELGATALISVDDDGDSDESGSFVADADMDIAIRVFSWDWAYVPGAEYVLEVDTRVSVTAWNGADPEVAEYDTYKFGNNGTKTVIFTAWTATDVVFTIELGDVFFGNYFVPELSNLEVTGDGAQKSISWDIFDYNDQETHTFEVLVSDDEGETFQLLVTGLTDTSYTWDSTGWAQQNYTILIRVADSSGLTSSLESEAFEAGTVEDTGPTTGTTTEPGPGFFGIDPLILGLIAGVGVGVVIVLILFLVKRR